MSKASEELEISSRWKLKANYILHRTQNTKCLIKSTRIFLDCCRILSNEKYLLKTHQKYLLVAVERVYDQGHQLCNFCLKSKSFFLVFRHRQASINTYDFKNNLIANEKASKLISKFTHYAIHLIFAFIIIIYSLHWLLITVLPLTTYYESKITYLCTYLTLNIIKLGKSKKFKNCYPLIMHNA